LPPQQPDGRIRSTTIEYVTVAGSPAEVGPESYFFGEPEEGSGRTPNGLRRRNPGARKVAAPTAPTPAGERPPLISDSPDQVRARLNAFRSGLQRGTEAERSSYER
jgi:hypothetical protein